MSEVRLGLLWIALTPAAAAAPLLPLALLAEWAYPWAGHWGWALAVSLWAPLALWIAVRCIRTMAKEAR